MIGTVAVIRINSCPTGVVQSLAGMAPYKGAVITGDGNY